jgi:acetyltransferase-like isoleucine patch superfamily enzyme
MTSSASRCAAHVGDDVYLGGKIFVVSGRVFDEPKLILKDRAAVGWGTAFTVNREVIVEEDAIVSLDCRISDSDGHCREADLRAAGVPPKPQDVRPVRISKHAWIGSGSHIMKGVTIGEGAVIGANSVVISNIPPYSLAMGNPAEVVLRNFGLPSGARSGASQRSV